MGGLGKTSLAKKVIAHEKVKNNFDGFAWACVSQEYNVKDILVEILIKLIPDQRKEVKEMIDHELFKAIYEIQQKKRCIVVLDDIWTKEAWNYLRAAFPIYDTGSKLLITTRNREVAEHIDHQGLFHELRCLSDQESWDLLKKRASPETKAIEFSSVGPGVGQGSAASQIPVINEDMKRLGNELLKKCGGIPLAIIVLGGLLAVNEWEKVYEKINLHFGDKSDVSKVLALSYDDLPWHLKPCFLYLGSFPEDAEIPATKVLHMWIAEGFVSPDAHDEERDTQVEDVAEQYLTELVNRGMVQARFNLSGKIKTCHLHDLMRDLCVSRAKRESFLSILNIQRDNETYDWSSSMAPKAESTCKIRRLSLNMRMSDERNMIRSLKQKGRAMLQLRTLMFFGYIEERWKWEQFQPIFTNCKFLRVLKLENLRMRGNLPDSVGDLAHLRFLSLAGSSFDGLPQSMENLVCMEFLDIRVGIYSHIILRPVTVPNVLWKMRKLRHLYLPIIFIVKERFFGGRKKLRLDTLKNLRTLKNFSSKNCDVNDVSKLSDLQKLTVSHCDKLEIIPQLAKFTLKHLRSSSFIFLGISFTEDELSKMSSYHQPCKLSIWRNIEKLPEHESLPHQLRKLVLVRSELGEDPMPILEKLQHLVFLMLGHGAFVGKEMVCSAGGFPKLKHLLLYELYNLEEWRVAEGAMPHLSRLGILQCVKLKVVPELEGVSTYDYYEDIVHEYDKFY